MCGYDNAFYSCLSETTASLVKQPVWRILWKNWPDVWPVEDNAIRQRMFAGLSWRLPPQELAHAFRPPHLSPSQSSTATQIYISPTTRASFHADRLGFLDLQRPLILPLAPSLSQGDEA